MPPVIIDLDSDSAPSPPAPPRPSAATKRKAIELDEDEDLPDIAALTSVANKAPVKKSKLLEQLNSINLDQYELLPAVATNRGKGKGKAVEITDDESRSEVARKPPPKKRGRLTEEEKQQREADKLAAKKAKEDAKAEEKTRKELAKDDSLTDNKLNKQRKRNDRIDDMRIDFSNSLASLPAFKPIYEKVRADLTETGIRKVSTFDSPNGLLLCRWWRYSNKVFNEERKRFEAYEDRSTHLVLEPTILLYVTVKELSTLQNLLDRVNAVRAAHDSNNVQVFLLVDGTDKYTKAETKRRNAELANRLNEVKSPSKKIDGLSMEDVETALLQLQMIEKCHILRPRDAKETIRWFREMTYDIGVRRDRAVEKSYLERLAIDGYFKPANLEKNGLEEGYLTMIGSLYRVGDGYAKSIVKKFPSMRKLYEAFERHPEPERMLIGVEKGRNADGKGTNQAMGADGARRIYRYLFCEDPSQPMAKMDKKGGATKRPAGQQQSDDED